MTNRIHSLTFVFFLSVTLSENTFALTCREIRDRAKPSEKSKRKAKCVMTEHTVGINRGSTLTTYECGGKTYILSLAENNVCTVSQAHK